MHDRVSIFSRGMKQRLAIARILLYDPKVLFLDEPYTGLDHNASKLLDDILRDFKDNSGTVIMATHDFEKGLKLSDRVAILVKGKIKYDKTAKKLSVKKLKSDYQKVIQGDYD
jgi:ABC-type multidrug transport system ATPase subunit